MFLLDSLMISGIRWALSTALTAAEAEMNDDTALREQLLEAEMRREMGEISDEEFRELEGEILTRLREIKERREGGSGPIAFGEGEPMESPADSRFQVEATVSGDFHGDLTSTPHTTIVETSPDEGGLVSTHGERTIEVLDMEPGDPNPIARRTRRTGATRPASRAARPASPKSKPKAAPSAKAASPSAKTGRTRPSRAATSRSRIR
jgi:hypothetical protein